MTSLLFLISGAILPIMLWPIEYLWPFPHFIEEIAKFLVLIFLIKNSFGIKQNKKPSLKMPLLFAISFTISESVLYLVNFFILGQFYLFPKRLLLTGILHITTVLIIFIGLNKNPLWKVTTLVLAIFLHYAYNQLLAIY